MSVIAIYAVYGTHVASLHRLDVGKVDHGYVHGDDSDDRGEFSADQDTTLVTEGTMHAVRVTCCKNANYGRALGDKFAAVANTGACRDASQAHDASAETHDRLEPKLAFGFGALLYGVVAGMVGVQDHGGAEP